MATYEEHREIAKGETVNMTTHEEYGVIAKGEIVNMATKEKYGGIAKRETGNMATQEEYRVIAKRETVNMATKEEYGVIAKGETVNSATHEDYGVIAKGEIVNMATHEEYRAAAKGDMHAKNVSATNFEYTITQRTNHDSDELENKMFFQETEDTVKSQIPTLAKQISPRKQKQPPCKQTLPCNPMTDDIWLIDDDFIVTLSYEQKGVSKGKSSVQNDKLVEESSIEVVSDETSEDSYTGYSDDDEEFLSSLCITSHVSSLYDSDSSKAKIDQNAYRNQTSFWVKRTRLQKPTDNLKTQVPMRKTRVQLRKRNVDFMGKYRHQPRFFVKRMQLQKPTDMLKTQVPSLKTRVQPRKLNVDFLEYRNDRNTKPVEEYDDSYFEYSDDSDFTGDSEDSEENVDDICFREYSDDRNTRRKNILGTLGTCKTHGFGEVELKQVFPRVRPVEESFSMTLVVGGEKAKIYLDAPPPPDVLG